MPPTHSALTEVELLDGEGVKAVHASVHALRHEWIRRTGAQPFYTLGTASYLDARDGGFTAYQRQAQQTNLILVTHFASLLDRLRRALSSHVKATVHFDDRLARPGFHIFLLESVFPHAGASVHFDLQYELIEWTGIGTPEPDSQLSMTLTIALPASGGGLRVWNVNRLALDRMPPDDRLAHAAENRVGAFVPYAPGRLVIHSGHQLHQIAAASDPRPGDERITMQAHALRVNGEWVLYW